MNPCYKRVLIHFRAFWKATSATRSKNYSRPLLQILVAAETETAGFTLRPD